MEIQKTKNPNTGEINYLVLDDNFLPVKPISKFIKHMKNINRSPNTIKSYIQGLKYWWEYLSVKDINDWTDISLDILSDFIHFLRFPLESKGVFKINNTEENKSARSDITINSYLSAISSFYDFYDKLGKVKNFPLFQNSNTKNRTYKTFLHHINKSKLPKNKIVKLKIPKKKPKILTHEQIKALIEACNNTRDKFLLAILTETGMRIGQVLGLKHVDIRSFDNEIDIIPRDDHPHLVRQKTDSEYTVHVSKELISLYTDYVINEIDEIESEYVFINLWEGSIGEPLTYQSVQKLVERLKKKTDIQFNLHMFRHTHATELIQNGWDMAHVQKRLGHKDIQTTINTYIHINNQDIKEKIVEYNKNKRW